MNPYLWRDWLGYPHEIGADPRFTNKCCCLKMIAAMYEELQLGKVPFNPAWYDLFKNNRLNEIDTLMSTHTKEIASALVWSVLYIKQRNTVGFGLVVQDYQFIIPHHRRGLQVYCLDKLPIEHRRFYKPL